MKNITTLNIDGKQYQIYLTIGDMRAIEREIGRSILSIFSGNSIYIVQHITIDALVSGLRHGIHDEKHGNRSDEEIYDLIQRYCDEGHTLDDMTILFIQAIDKTGLYTPPQFKPSKKAPAGKNKPPEK